MAIHCTLPKAHCGAVAEPMLNGLPKTGTMPIYIGPTMTIFDYSTASYLITAHLREITSGSIQPQTSQMATRAKPQVCFYVYYLVAGELQTATINQIFHKSSFGPSTLTVK